MQTLTILATHETDISIKAAPWMTMFEDFFNRQAAPNAVQLAFIRQMAARAHYLLLGDTEHACEDIEIFATDKSFIAALSAGGIKQMCLERPPLAQFFLDELKTLKKEDERLWAVSRDAVAGLSVADEKAREKILLSFAGAAAGNPGFRFTATDRREREKIDKLMVAEFEANLRGREADRKRLAQQMGHAILDDSGTAEFIWGQGGPCAVFYGAGHFNNSACVYGHTKDMRGYLASTGKPVLTVNIYRDKNQQRENAEKRAASFQSAGVAGSQWKPVLPDADLYVFPPADAPHGIGVHNPDLEPLYRAALKI